MKDVLTSHSRFNIWLPAVVLLACACAGGCDIIAGLASMSPPKDQPALYKGLAKQHVAVMVWVSRGPAADFPDLQAEIAAGLQSKLAEAKVSELQGTTFINPMSVVRFQDDHPDLEGVPVQEVAPRLGASRVIYIEVESFETHAHESMDRYLGSILADVTVVEVEGGVGRIAYHERNIQETYPHNVPEGVDAEDGGEDVRRRTISLFTTDVSQRFYAHAPRDDQMPANQLP